MRDGDHERGQASVELVAVLPLVAVLLLAAWQGVVAGQAWWLAAAAARAGARADAAGLDVAAAARRELPGGARDRLVTRVGRAEIVTRVPIPGIAGVGRLGTATARTGRAER